MKPPRFLEVSLLGLLLFAMTASAFAQPPTETVSANERQSRDNLQMLGQALARYLVYNDGRLPERISDLYKQGFVLDLSTFVSPASGKRLASEGEIDAQTDYQMVAKLTDDRPLLLFKEKSAFHNGQALAFYSDRSIRKTAAVTKGIPSAVGMSGADAKKVLVRDGFTNVVFAAAEAPAPARDKEFTIQRQNPPAGADVDRKSIVTLFIFGKASAAGPNDLESRPLPAVVGLSAVEAKKKLALAGFTVVFSAADVAAPSKERQFTIQRQEPAAGVIAGPRTAVTLFVYPH